MAFERFQDFLSNLVSGQRSLFSSGESSPIDQLLEQLMGSVGEVSGIVTARQVLDHYHKLSDEEKLAFFQDLEQNFNADPDDVKEAYDAYAADPSSINLNQLSYVTDPLRIKLLRRLNQTPRAAHDLLAMRADLIRLLREHPELRAVDEDFHRVFRSWFGRGFLELKTIDWSTSAAVLERIIRYEAVHAIKDWDDLRSRIDQPNRRTFAFFHPALVDEPLIFVEVALLQEIPDSIATILDDRALVGEAGKSRLNGGGPVAGDYKVAAFYSISNCQPGLKNVSFGNFLIKQVVMELQAEFPSIKQFVTLSPIPGFGRWLAKEDKSEPAELADLKTETRQLARSPEELDKHAELIRKCVVNYLILAKRGMYPLDSVARFHLGNGASIHKIHTDADRSARGIEQSLGAMVNYLYDPKVIERNHESYAEQGDVHYSDKLKSLLLKL